MGDIPVRRISSAQEQSYACAVADGIRLFRISFDSRIANACCQEVQQGQLTCGPLDQLEQDLCRLKDAPASLPPSSKQFSAS